MFFPSREGLRRRQFRIIAIYSTKTPTGNDRGARFAYFEAGYVVLSCDFSALIRKVSVIRFRVVRSLREQNEAGHDVVCLVEGNWDDWFKFSTLFNATYIDPAGHEHLIGGVKIGQFGLKPARGDEKPQRGYRSPQVPGRFEGLDSTFFSLGQDTSYYETLKNIGDSFREEFLRAMRDLAFDTELLDRASAEQVTKVSLLRDVPLQTVRDQFARLAGGGARLTRYDFTFWYGGTSGSDAVPLEFAVEPDSLPPSNIHVLIGRNGVGKSTFLDECARAMVLDAPPESETQPESGTRSQISNVVSVSFSAFDVFEPISVPQDRTKGITYHYVGLKKIPTRKDEVTGPKDPAALSREMTASAKRCLVGARRSRFSRALRLLESDPVFADAGVAELADEGAEALGELPDIFRRLSSGHKIVLLTIAKLVETVEEKSLVLLDEPEAHLHPPLLSAFVRALSDLLTHRNGMAIVATHSPVVLQEVPRNCVWILHRSGSVLTRERPKIETFGENVGTLTDEVFGLEVRSTGFHRMLQKAADEATTYDEALEMFDHHLGEEGRAILRAMIRPDVMHHVG